MCPPIAGLESGVMACRPRSPREYQGTGFSLVGWASLLYCTWWAQSGLGPSVHRVLMLALPLGDFLTHTDFPGWFSVNLSENRKELLV